MAVMTTALTEFSTIGDKRTYTTSGHTVSHPKVVVFKRKVPSGNQVMSEISTSVIHATDDANNELLKEKWSFEVIARGPINGDTADRDAALVIFRDIVASDEFTASVSTSNYLS